MPACAVGRCLEDQIMYRLEVSDCDILIHHNSRITYHNCENYHDCHILQIFGTNKQAVVYKNHVTVLF